jgi:tetratricopeptide (TPR) repeat protein
MVRMSLVLVALLLCGATAFAEEDAKSLFTRGRAQYALGHFREAADLFEKAFELKQDPAILYNAAQAHRLAGDKKQALVLYQNYLRLFGEMENAAEVERRITELKAAIEAEQKANTNPPTGLLGDKTEAPPPAVTPTPTEPAPAAVVTQPAPEKPRPKRAWIWGVVAGGVVLVGGAIALGVVFGTTHKDPAATLGAVQAN